MKRCLLLSLHLPVLMIMQGALISCVSSVKPVPVPDHKKAFIGVWTARAGFKMEIKSSGTADVYESNLISSPDNDTLVIGVIPEYAKDMIVEFSGDTLLIIKKPLVRAREYQITKNPFMDGDTCKMILNGVLLIKKK